MKIKNPFKINKSTDINNDLVMSVDNAGKGDTPTFFYPFGNYPLSLNTIDTSTVAGQMNSFLKCPAVSTVILKLIEAHKNAEIEFKNIKDNTDAKGLLIKYLSKLLNKPNVLQTWEEFDAQLELFRHIHGIAYIMPIYPFGFEKSKNPTDIEALFVIPNNFINPIRTGRFMSISNNLKSIIDYYLVSDGVSQWEIEPDKIIVIRDYTIRNSIQNDSFSKLTPLKDSINYIVNAIDAMNSMTEDRGAVGIISSNKDQTGTPVLMPKEKKELQDTYTSGYGIRKGLNKLIVTSASINYQPITFNIRDLMLIEGIEDHFRMISNGLGYPFDLLGFQNSGIFQKGDAEAKKTLYNDTIIPESKLKFRILSNYFNTLDSGFEIKSNFLHLEVFQKAAKETAMAFKFNMDALHVAYLDKAINIQTYNKKVSEFVEILEGVPGDNGIGDYNEDTINEEEPIEE